MNYLSANLRLTGSHLVRRVDGSKTWFDPVVGVQPRTPDTGQRWHAQVYTETGAPVIDPDPAVNIVIGSWSHLTECGSWMILSGRTKLTLGSVGLRYEWSKTGEIAVRRFQEIPQLKARFKLSMVGVVYSVGLLYSG